MKQRLDLEAVRVLVKQAVANFGEDYRYSDHYEACVYVSRKPPRTPKITPDGEYAESLLSNELPLHPACLVGHALVTHDPALLEQLDHAHCTISDLVSDEGRTLFGTVDLPEFTPEALIYLQVAQTYQDRGETWGEAVALAEQAVARG